MARHDENYQFPDATAYLEGAEVQVGSPVDVVLRELQESVARLLEEHPECLGSESGTYALWLAGLTTDGEMRSATRQILSRRDEEEREPKTGVTGLSRQTIPKGIRQI